MIPEQFIWIGVLVNLFASIWYAKTVADGGTKPNLVSWLIWSLAPFIGTFLALKAGAGLAASGIFLAGFGPLMVIVVSLFKKNVFWKILPFDLVCGFFSIVALVLYVLTNNLAVSIIFAILSDFLAAVPTLRKTWNFPETEHFSTYTGGIINNIFALLIIKNWSFSIFAFPIYFITINLAILFAIYRKKIF